MSHHIPDAMQVKLADVAAATSGLVWLSAKASEWAPILQDISFLIASVAGVVAIFYHLHNWDRK